MRSPSLRTCSRNSSAECSNQAALIDEWHRGDALRDGLDRKRAADILWALTGPAVYSVFVREAGWTPRAFERWLVSALEWHLFG